MSKIAVCVNHYSPSVGGAEIVTETITDHLNKDHEVFVFTRKLQKSRDLSSFDYPIFEYRPQDFGMFEKKLKSLNADYILVYSDVFDFFRQLITNYKGDEKLVLCLCGANWLYSQRNYVNALYRKMFKIQAIVCHSTQDRDYNLCSVDKFKEKLVVIPNGIWKDEFDKNSLTKTDLLPRYKDTQWILNVSNFFPGKGQEHLINILGLMSSPENKTYIQISNDIDFAIGAQLEARWKSRIPKLKKQGFGVKLLKNIDREKVVGFFKQSNAFAFSSEKEVAPLVLLESMAANLPWIATNIGNAQDLSGGIVIPCMKDSRFHSAFTTQTQQQFATGIQELLNSPKIAETGKRQVEKYLTWDRVLPQYSYLFKE